MVDWSEFAIAAPDLAARGRRLIERTGEGRAFLATVRDPAPPRIHPITVGIADGQLLAFLIVGSAKVADLAANGRYALHAHQDPAEPHEFLVRGHASEITDPERRAAVAARWAFTADVATGSLRSRSSMPCSASEATRMRGRPSTRPGAVRRGRAKDLPVTLREWPPLPAAIPAWLDALLKRVELSDSIGPLWCPDAHLGHGGALVVSVVEIERQQLPVVVQDH